jgi:hypothetical protein
MTTTTETKVNGAAKSGVPRATGRSSSAGAEAAAADNGGEEAGEEIASRTDGLGLFGTGPLTQEETVKRLQSYLSGGSEEPTEPAAGAVQTTETPEGEVQTGGEGEPTEEELAAAQATEEEDPEKQTEELPESERPPKEWPKSAIQEVTKLREKVRTAREESQQQIVQLQTELENEELKRPVIVQGDPLSFATTPQELQAWEKNTRRMTDLMSDAIDGELDDEDRGRLEQWAKANGAWDESTGDFNRARLKKEKRNAEDALRDLVPQRKAFFQKEQQFTAMVDKDPVLGPIWTDKAGAEYQDAMAVVKTIPGIRHLPHWKAAAAIYALGLREYKKLTPQGAGQPGSGANGAAVKGKLPPSKVPAGKKTVQTPGRSTVLPRARLAEDQPNKELIARVQSGKGATNEDYVQYTKLQLSGKIAAR